jgi:hypothetical protein
MVVSTAANQGHADMTRTDLLRRVKQRPFVPFRLVLSEGTTYDIRHPDFIMVGRDSVTIGLPGEQEQDFYETSVLVDLFHVVRMEPIPAQPASTGRA